MRGMKPSLALAAVAVVGLALWAGAFVDHAGGRMAEAADRFVRSLDKEQAARATFPFDSPERLNWHFIPRPRKGLPIKDMTPAQRALAFGLLNTGVGASGVLKATTIMSLEQILKEMEQGSGPVRDPELYFLSIFGKPGEGGKWGWRIEGHHLSLNFTMEGTTIVSATPAFFGANPAEVRQGPRWACAPWPTWKTVPCGSCSRSTPTSRRPRLSSPRPPRTSAPPTRLNPTDRAEGIAYGNMTDEQKRLFQALVESYAADMPPDVAKAWLDEIMKAGAEEVRFAWQGPAERNQPHGYKVQGPTFLIEFNNTQNNANHIHSVWRNMLGDFGVPLAAK